MSAAPALPPLQEEQIEAMARAMGLDLALAMFRDDLIAACRQAELQRRNLEAGLSPSDEPWPPMRISGAP